MKTIKKDKIIGSSDVKKAGLNFNHFKKMKGERRLEYALCAVTLWENRWKPKKTWCNSWQLAMCNHGFLCRCWEIHSSKSSGEASSGSSGHWCWCWLLLLFGKLEVLVSFFVQRAWFEWSALPLEFPLTSLSSADRQHPNRSTSARWVVSDNIALCQGGI